MGIGHVTTFQPWATWPSVLQPMDASVKPTFDKSLDRVVEGRFDLRKCNNAGLSANENFQTIE